MVSNHEERRQAIRANLVEGVTQCGGSAVTGKECNRVHGTTVPSFDGKHSIPVRFEKGALIGSELVVFCSLCAIFARKAGLDVQTIDEIERRVLAMFGATPVAPNAPTPVLEPPPPPVMPSVGRVPVVRKDVPSPALERATAKLAEATELVKYRQPAAPGKEEQKPARTPSGPHPRTTEGHLVALHAAKSFEDAFTQKANKLCSCAACDAKSGNGFVTRNGDYQGKRFPVCPAAIKAARDYVGDIRKAQSRPFFLFFTDEADWLRFDKNRKDDADRNATRAQQVLEGDFEAREGRCAVQICGAPQPEDRIACIEGGTVVEHRVCKICAGAAMKLRRQLQQEGGRWAFHVLRGSQKLTAQEGERLHKAARALTEMRERRELIEQANARSKAKPAAPKAAKPKSGKVQPPVKTPGTMGEKLVAALEQAEAKKARSSKSQPAPRAEEPAAEPVIAPAPEAAPDAPAPPLSGDAPQPPSEGPIMGGGN